MSDTAVLRPAHADDAAALLDIYTPLVRDTATSFELEPPSVAEFRHRIEEYGAGWGWFVAVDPADRPLAYAYGTPHRTRPAYRWSVETSVYVAGEQRGRGLGRRLYTRLFEHLADRGYCNAYAGITLPNPASVALHQAAGFAAVGVFQRVGFKFGRWHDVSWWHRVLREQPAAEA